MKRRYTGWPKRNATLTINYFKKTRDRMKKLCALLRIKFFSQQDDTNNANFDEGVLIPILWCNVIFKICTSISKVTIYVPKIFHCLASPGKVSALALLSEASVNSEKHSLRNFAALQSGGATQRNSSLPQTWHLIQKNDIASEKLLWNQNAFIKSLIILLEKECVTH